MTRRPRVARQDRWVPPPCIMAIMGWEFLGEVNMARAGKCGPFYPQTDKKLFVADVQTIAEAMLLRYDVREAESAT